MTDVSAVSVASDGGHALVVLVEGCRVFWQERAHEILRIVLEVLEEGGNAVGIEDFELVFACLELFDLAVTFGTIASGCVEEIVLLSLEVGAFLAESSEAFLVGVDVGSRGDSQIIGLDLPFFDDGVSR